MDGHLPAARRLRVLFVTEFMPWPLNTGGRIRSFNILRQVALRHDVTLVTQVDPEAEPGLEEVRKWNVELAVMPRARTSKLQKALRAAAYLPSRTPFVFAYSAYRPALERVVNELIESGKFDLLHLDHLDAAVYLKDRWRSRLAIYLDQHNYETGLLRSTLEQAGGLRRWYLGAELPKLEQFESSRVNAAHAVGVVSSCDGNKLRSVAPNAMLEIVPNGVNLEFFDIERKPIPHRVVAVGSLDWPPNRDGMFWFVDRVWPIVRAELKDATLQIVGRNPPPSLLNRDSSGIHVAANVSDVRPYVAEGAAFVVPLFAGGGTRLKVLEAMAMRIPIVSTTIGVEGIRCEPDKHVLVADDPEPFARRLIEVLEQPELAARFASAGRALVEDSYGWSAIGEQLAEVYARIAPAGANQPAAAHR